MEPSPERWIAIPTQTHRTDRCYWTSGQLCSSGLPNTTRAEKTYWEPVLCPSASIAVGYPPDRANHRDVLPKSAFGQSHSSSSGNYWHNDDHVRKTERRIRTHIKIIFVWLAMISSNQLQIKYVVVYLVFRICPRQLLQECLAQIDMIIYFCSFLQKNKPLQESCVCIWEIIYKIKIAWQETNVKSCKQIVDGID